MEEKLVKRGSRKIKSYQKDILNVFSHLTKCAVQLRIPRRNLRKRRGKKPTR